MLADRSAGGRATERILLCAWLLAATLSVSDSSVAQGWPQYAGNAAGERYSTLDQINRDNVEDLDVAWIYRTGEPERRGDVWDFSMFQNTPILLPEAAGGSLIVCSPFNRIIALDPATGTERWVFEPEVPLDNWMPYTCRGVTAWTDADAVAESACANRLFFGTNDARVFSIDARTGERCSGFGDDGEIRINIGKEEEIRGEVKITSPPAVINDTVVFGTFVRDMLRIDAPSGRVRAFDARTGELKWTFDAVPRDPDDPAASSWHGDSAQTVGGANVWSLMSVDEARDLVFLPTTSPSVDFYGGHRPGDNRYANSVVALRGSTGELVWHFQVVHHDLWDYDIASQPVLVDMPIDGTMVPAVAQATKQGFLFLLHRETGEPLFPVEERPVPQISVDTEWVSPTQPYPSAPPPLIPQGLAPDDAWGFTWFDRRSCRQKIEAYRSEGLYTPPSVEGTVLMPSSMGGANWGSLAHDPSRRLVVVNTNRVPAIVKLIPREEVPGADTRDDQPAPNEAAINPQRGTPYVVEFEFLVSNLGAPCSAPPWGGLTAVDLATGEFVWDVALGSIEKMMPVPIPLDLGTPNMGGPIITAGGLVFIAASMDDRFRAFDVDTGDVLWEAKLPAGGQATPMTYESGGRQYLVLAAGGHVFLGTTRGDYLMAYALPDD